MIKTAKKWLKVSSVLVAASAVPYYFFFYASAGDTPFIPPAFLEARTRGSVFAENIVKLNAESIDNLKLISDEDKAGNYSGGIDLIIKELSRNELARQSAIGLSKELEIMASHLEEVRPKEAMNVGLQAILSESQTVQRLLNYNNDIYQLLDILRLRFENNGASGAERVGSLLAKMNEESRSINELNAKYAELMAKFDFLTSVPVK